MRHLLFAATLGLVIGFEPACGGACSHNCCQHRDCHCLGGHCCQADPDAEDPMGHCAALLRDFTCTVTYKDGNGDVIGTDDVLYEKFAYQQGAIDTCSILELDSPDAPEGVSSAACACDPTEDTAPTDLAAPG
jgi:hypothetical protein